MTELDRIKSKMAKQRNEVARLTQLLQTANKEIIALRNDLKWIKGEVMKDEK